MTSVDNFPKGISSNYKYLKKMANASARSVHVQLAGGVWMWKEGATS